MTDGAAPGMPPTLRVADISKTYPGVRALQQVDLEVMPGEIHAVIGENGAGKSTLMKIIFGVTQPDAGTIELQGRAGHDRIAGRGAAPRDLDGPPGAHPSARTRRGAQYLPRAGSQIWHRESSIGRASTPTPRRCCVACIFPSTRAARSVGLSTAQKQMVEIARALSWKSRLLISTSRPPP